ncbi:hypothetical protein [Pelomicrobium sp.]|uniref:hypothetical protein n=1 Tax=Pelomicrobium sp. TaxID=2815319 RepID=UPI002FDE1689
MLEEVQMPQPPGSRVVGWMDLLDPWHGKPAASDEIDTDGQRLLRGVKINFPNESGFGNAQGGFKQLGAPASSTSHRSSKRACYPNYRQGFHGSVRQSTTSRHGLPIPRVRTSRARSARLQPLLTNGLGNPITYSIFKRGALSNSLANYRLFGG